MRFGGCTALVQSRRRSRASNGIRLVHTRCRLHDVAVGGVHEGGEMMYIINLVAFLFCGGVAVYFIINRNTGLSALNAFLAGINLGVFIMGNIS